MSSQIENILADIARNEYLRMKEAQHLSISLLAGDMGSVVYLYEYSRFDPSFQPFADDLLGKVLSGLRRVRPEVTYCNGVAGMVIGLYALYEQGFIEDFSSLLDDIDNYLNLSLNVMLQNNNHDFLHGFIGLGFYWLRRYKTGNADAIDPLVRVVKHLMQTSEKENEITKWPLPETKWGHRYNISLSHGCSSTIIMLCRMLEIPELKSSYGELIEQMIKGAVNYILVNRLDYNKFGCWFASSSLECEIPHRSRLGWCYGDLGISVALHEAGKTMQDSRLIDMSREVLEFSGQYRRNLERNYVYDACVCHGAAGIGLIYREMSRMLASPVITPTADYWRDAVIQQVIEGNEGFTFSFYDVSSREYKRKTGLLEGNVGVAMYLLNEIASSSLSNYLLITEKPLNCG